MKRLRIFLLTVVGIPLCIILLWFIAIPESLIKSAIEDGLSQYGQLDLNVTLQGLKKGMFFTISAESLDLEIDKTPALKITDIKSRINPFYLVKKQIAFSVNGKLGSGDIRGSFILPGKGHLNINKAELSSIQYLAYAGFKGSGLITADFSVHGDIVDVVFQIPDSHLKSTMIPLLADEYRIIQGVVTLKENSVQVKSISLEADKGYARLKGNIKNGLMNMNLEIMPDTGKLEKYESMLLARYLVSPGYYVIPIKGPML
jgi:type II secretion system protein N